MEVLKIKVGEVYINGKSEDVFVTAWEKESKNKVKYYEIKTPVFIQQVNKTEIEKEKVE